MNKIDYAEIAVDCGAVFKCETLLINGKDADDFIMEFAAAIEAETLKRAQQPASARPVAVPDGYVLAKIPHTYAKTMINGGWNLYADGWNDCRAAMLSASQKPEGV